jgi:hypothetical protein
MLHHRTPIGALGAVLFALFVLSASPAAAAPKGQPGKAGMAAEPAPRPVATPAPAPRPAPEAAPAGRASAGNPAPAPLADPGPTSGPGSAGAATTPSSPDSEADADRRDRGFGRGSDHALTSILVPIAFFLCILLLVGTIQFLSFRKDRNKHQTLQLMVERGAQIPVELITPQKRQGSDLRRGLVLLGAGLGIGLFLLMTKDARNSGAFGLGLIPALIGGGYLLAWKLEGRQRAEPSRPTTTYTGGDLERTRRDDASDGPVAQ